MSSKTKDDGSRGFADIFANLLFSVPVGIALFSIFCLFRPKYKDLYYANVGKSTHLKPGGRLEWLKYIWHVDDVRLLTIAGMDGFVTVQITKLILVLLCCLAVICLGLLMPLYWVARKKASAFSTTTHDLFFDFTIRVLPDNLLWIPMIVSYIVSGIVFYFVYGFYRAFNILRQAYLLDAASFTSIPQMRHLVNAFGGDLEMARQYINSKHRAVILCGINAKYDQERLCSFLTPLGSIQSAHFVHSREKLKLALDRRNEYLEHLENAYQDFYQSLLKYIISTLNQTENMSTLALNEMMAQFESVLKSENIPLLRKYVLLGKIHEPTFMSSCRPTHVHSSFHHSTTKEDMKHSKDMSTLTESPHEDSQEATEDRQGDMPVLKDAITYYHNAITVKDQKYTERLAEFLSELDDDVLVASEDPEDLERRYSLNNTSNSNSYISLVSMNMTKILNTLRDFKLTLWGTSRSAVIVFSEASAASNASQLVLSFRPMSLFASPAPAAEDMLWNNVYLPTADRKLRSIAGSIMYLMLHVLFLVIAVAFAGLLELDSLMNLFPFIKPIVNITPAATSVIRGVLAPLAFTLCFLIVPYALLSIALYRGAWSKTAVDGWVVSHYAWFLLLQLSVIGFFPGKNLLELFGTWRGGNLQSELAALQANLPAKAAFFMNMIIQKTFVSIGLLVLKPAQLVLELLKKTVNKKPREYLHPQPQSLLLRTIYPELLVFEYLMCMAFMIVTPISIVAGILFFLLMYYAMKYQFIYSNVVTHESGGMYWPWISKHIMIGIPAGQLFLLFQLIVSKQIFESILMMPLIIGTLYAIPAMEANFRHTIMYPALTAENRDIVERICTEAAERQKQFFSSDDEFDEQLSIEKFDLIPLNFTTLANQDHNEDMEKQRQPPPDAPTQNPSNPYLEPMLLKKSQLMVLSKGLVPLTNWLLLNNCTPSRQAIELYIKDTGKQ